MEHHEFGRYIEKSLRELQVETKHPKEIEKIAKREKNRKAIIVNSIANNQLEHVNDLKEAKPIKPIVPAKEIVNYKIWNRKHTRKVKPEL